ncbi:MAG TPA: exopolysaccharide biosynthesis polyprenyl glycosylphosphotransferase [Hellea balneolensis]|uniref:Exopolysaccharide biosynthesis polyprenyl glycosylphosphotransferase n=1 Tax=Hellea balneolensis TaxID=287478 RepID=A0A7C5M374_9PROT|nr:exopolysaccharide biosynthesis polyprenyl glycosylphosphotransferase [Hellea balneolensis]
MKQSKHDSVKKRLRERDEQTNKPQHQSIETLGDFARRTGQDQDIGRDQNPAAPASSPKESTAHTRPLPRTPLSDIKFSKNTSNMGALRAALRLSDGFWISLVILVSIWNGYIGVNNKEVIAPLAAGISGALGFLASLYLIKAYRFSPTETYGEHLKTVALGSAAALGAWLSIALIAKPDTFLPDALAIAGLWATGALLIVHSVYYIIIKRKHERGDLIPRIIMLGATETARRLIEENARSRELQILAIFDERLSRAPHDIHGVPVVGKIEDMLNWDALPYVDRIVVTLPSMARDRRRTFINQVRKLPNRIAFLVDEFENLNHVQQRVSDIAEISMREITGKPKPGYQIFIKRLTDVTLSGTALLFGAPVLALIAVLIKLDSPGPVLFKQKRQGFNNRVFDVYKFRSLKVENEDKDARSQVEAGDTRVTKIGRFIRKTSLDELPQLINVLKGDMSLVGPRPHAVGMHTGNVQTYKLVEDYAHRLKVKPGLTGWAQINGSRGPLHSGEDVARRVQLDMEYIERSNFIFDISIMLKTLPCLLGDSENIR